MPTTDPEKRREINKRYYEKAGREKFSYANRYSTQEQKDKRNAYSREWRKRNLESRREYEKKYQSKWTEENKDLIKTFPSRSRSRRYTKEKLAKKYGLTYEAYLAMLEGQNNQCAVCQVKFGDTFNLRPVVDHNHKTNKVRGILCSGCNVSIGRLGDTANSLQKAADYLRNTDGEG